MKSAKILFAIFILLSFTYEGFNAYRQTGSLWFFIIIVMVSLIISGLLIRSAFKPKEGILQVNKFKKYLWSFLKIISIIGIIGLIIIIVRPQPNQYIIEINGLKIPLDKCIAGNVNIISDLKERNEYCACMAQKMVNDADVISNYKSLLQNGQFDEIMADLKNKDKFKSLGLENCYKLTNSLKWTETMKKSIKTDFSNQLKGSYLELTNDIEKYCDCLVEKLEKIPANKVISGEIYLSWDWLKIDSICKENSKNYTSN